jgi:hypothetical protein
MKMVAQWMEENVERKKQLPGYNSFVAHKARRSIRWIYMFLKDPVVPDKETHELEKLPDSDKPLMIMTDIFTKVVGVVPIETKELRQHPGGAQDSLRKDWMGGQPEVLYSDQEPGLRAAAIIKYLDSRRDGPGHDAGPRPLRGAAD